jgi:hypothetical protein
MLKIINYCLFLLQKSYRDVRHGGEKLSLNYAFFHQNNSKKKVLGRFKKTLDKIGFKHG